MFSLARHPVRNILVIFFLTVAVAAWNYAADLRTRFPGMDFSRAAVGISSWYSRTDKGINERTANNEIFDDRAMTCASWNYPFGEKLLVVNLLSGKWVVCRVNDRGPALRLRREIDLTKSAFEKIANLRRGLIMVAVIPVSKIRENNKRKRVSKVAHG